MRNFFHPQGCVTLLVEDCQQGRLTWAFGVEVLLGLSHIVPTWLTFVSRTAHRFGLMPLLSRLERIQLFQSPHHKSHCQTIWWIKYPDKQRHLYQSTSWPKDNFPVAESKGQISLWVNSSQVAYEQDGTNMDSLHYILSPTQKPFSEITIVALKRKKHVLIGFDTNLGVLTRTQNNVGSQKIKSISLSHKSLSQSGSFDCSQSCKIPRMVGKYPYGWECLGERLFSPIHKTLLSTTCFETVAYIFIKKRNFLFS